MKPIVLAVCLLVSACAFGMDWTFTVALPARSTVIVETKDPNIAEVVVDNASLTGSVYLGSGSRYTFVLDSAVESLRVTVFSPVPVMLDAITIETYPATMPSLEEIRAHLGESGKGSVFDLNGDGRINVLDLIIARNRL